MARYIDADGLIEKLQQTICSKCNMYDGIKCKSCGIDDTLNFLENAPTADVVPKSEYDAAIIDRNAARLGMIAEHERLKTAKAEVARGIFMDIDRVVEKYSMSDIEYPEFVDNLAELKKKYTGGGDMKVYNRYCIVNYLFLEATGDFLDCRKCPMDCKCKDVEVEK